MLLHADLSNGPHQTGMQSAPCFTLPVNLLFPGVVKGPNNTSLGPQASSHMTVCQWWKAVWQQALGKRESLRASSSGFVSHARIP